MPVTIPLWVIGRSVSAVLVTPLVSDGSGNLTAASMGAQSYLAIADEVSVGATTQTQEVSALTARRKNTVVLEEDMTMTVTEVMRNGTAFVLSAAIWTASDTPDWALYQFSRGSQTFTVYGLMVRFEEDVQKGKSLARLTIRIVDVGATPNGTFA